MFEDCISDFKHAPGQVYIKSQDQKWLLTYEYYKVSKITSGLE